MRDSGPPAGPSQLNEDLVIETVSDTRLTLKHLIERMKADTSLSIFTFPLAHSPIVKIHMQHSFESRITVYYILLELQILKESHFILYMLFVNNMKQRLFNAE